MNVSNVVKPIIVVVHIAEIMRRSHTAKKPYKCSQCGKALHFMVSLFNIKTLNVQSIFLKLYTS